MEAKEWQQASQLIVPPSLHKFLTTESDYLVTEGELVLGQIASMLKFLAENPNLKRCLEIGFNGGRSAATILSSRPDITLLSVDIGVHPYVLMAKQRIDRFFPGRHTLVVGDSMQAIPGLAELFGVSFDFVFIDGGHGEPVPRLDIQNCLRLCSNQSVFCVDDWCAKYGSGGVNQAIEDFMRTGALLCIERFKSEDRGWGFFKVGI